MWSHYTEPRTGHEVWTYYLTPGYTQVIIIIMIMSLSLPHQNELAAWAGCLADQQLEFSDKNYSVTAAGVWSRIEVSRQL